MRPEILVSIAFCQLHICICSYQGVDNVLVIGAQVTIRERSTPTNTATFKSGTSSLNNLILPPPPTSNTEQLSAADNSDIQISWTRQTEQTSECRMTSTPRPRLRLHSYWDGNLSTQRASQTNISEIVWSKSQINF